MAQTYQGCRVCGQNVIHLDGKYNAVIHSCIWDSSYRPHANVAQGVEGNLSVLFEKAFHIPINIGDSIYDGLDDTTVPINPTATILGETPKAVTASVVMENTNSDTEMEDAIAEANEMFLCIRILRTWQLSKAEVLSANAALHLVNPTNHWRSLD
jgi:hypothetical protein